MTGLQIAVHSKYGPRIQRQPRGQLYHCLAYPCPNLTRLFYRPANSDLCAACIRKREPKITEAGAQEPPSPITLQDDKGA